MKAENPTRDFPQEVVFLPGVACQVYVGVADDKFRDRLQQAVITLMRARPKESARGVAVKELADELCVPPGILESVLLALEEDDLVRSQDGIFTLAETATISGPLRDCIGWMFWNSLAKEFLPTLLLDTNSQGLPRCSAPQSDLDAADQHRHQEKIPPGAMLEAARHPEFVIGRLTLGFSIETANQLQVRSISREGPRRGWPLAILAEIRPRFGGTPAVFLHAPRPLPDWPAEPTFAPFLYPTIKEQLPAKATEIDRLARGVQSRFLRENHVEFLEKLGGAQKVLAEAESSVESELAGAKLVAQFRAADLKTAARDAELNLILFQHDSSLISEASVRRDFATVLQAIGCIVSDISADTLQRPDVIELARTLITEFRKTDIPDRKDEFQPDRLKFFRHRLSKLEDQLGCSFQEWRELLTKNVSALSKLLKEASWESKRHTLGAAFTCWCAVPLIDQSSPSAQAHLRWMESATSDLPNLPATYATLKDVRNEDKVAKVAKNAPSLEDFRADVYALWRAFGRDWR